jgi:hypothetical protein
MLVAQETPFPEEEAVPSPTLKGAVFMASPGSLPTTPTYVYMGFRLTLSLLQGSRHL